MIATPARPSPGASASRTCLTALRRRARALLAHPLFARSPLARALPVLSALGLAVSAPSVQAANYALVVGIDEYAYQTDLGGATNDARLIASALRDFGVTDMRVLLDGQADRRSLEAAWQDLLARAGPGDTMVLTYSGHGTSVPDTSGDEASASQLDDTRDEILVLPGYDPQDPAGASEMILDDQLHQWFLDAADKGVQVVFLADSCYSGTVSRGGQARKIEGFSDDYDVRLKPQASLPETAEETIENVVFLAGARESEVVLEVVIEGRYHGALSYAFSRALSMAADADGDGALSRDELARFIPRTAESFNQGRYLPELNARGGADFAVLVPDRGAGGPGPGAMPDFGDEGVVTVAGDSMDVVPLADAPGTSWDRRTGDITDATGEVLGFGVDEARLGEVNDKFRLLGLVREGLVRNGMDAGLRVGGAPHHGALVDGTAFTIELGPLPHPYVTVFNLANNGEVQRVFPWDASERGPMEVGEVLRFDVRAQAPFGADELVAVSTQDPPDALRRALTWSEPAVAFEPILARLLARGEAAFAHLSLVTEEK